MKMILKSLGGAALAVSLLCAGSAFAQQTGTVEAAVGEPLPAAVAKAKLNNITGVWKSYGDEDDQGKKEAKALLRITEKDGVYQAVISEPLTEEGKTAVCTECTGAQKGKPFKGLKLMDGVKYNADGKQWDGGEILDPEKGKTYRVSLKLLKGGQELEVTGHLFLFSRSQIWTRVK